MCNIDTPGHARRWLTSLSLSFSQFRKIFKFAKSISEYFKHFWINKNEDYYNKINCNTVKTGESNCKTSIILLLFSYLLQNCYYT